MSRRKFQFLSQKEIIDSSEIQYQKIHSQRSQKQAKWAINKRKNPFRVKWFHFRFIFINKFKEKKSSGEKLGTQHPNEQVVQSEEDNLLKRLNEMSGFYELVQKKIRKHRKKMFKSLQCPKIAFKSISFDIDHILCSSNKQTIFSSTKQQIIEYIALILKARNKLIQLYDQHLLLFSEIEKYKDTISIKNKTIKLREQVEALMPFYRQDDFLSQFAASNNDDIYTFLLEKWSNGELTSN